MAGAATRREVLSIVRVLNVRYTVHDIDVGIVYGVASGPVKSARAGAGASAVEARRRGPP